MQTLTRKEEQIMQAVWQIGHPCLISEILKKDVTLKRNTVAPGIITLTKKGYLKVDSIGKSMTRTGRAYAPLIDQHAYNEQKKLIQCVVDSPTTKGGILNYIQSLIDTNQADDAFTTALKEKQKSSVFRFITLLSVTFPHSHSYYLSAVTPVFNDGTDGYR